MKTTNIQTDLSGVLGQRVTVRKVNNRVLITNRPARKPRILSDKQEAFHEKFQEAAHYAKQQISDEESKSMYATGITDKLRTAYVVALTDYLKAPKVRLIDPSNYDGSIGSTIVVKAVDDFMVASVKVVITGSNGTKIEAGEATADLIKAHVWTYEAKVANPSVAGTTIQVTAYDRPGNSGSAEKVL